IQIYAVNGLVKMHGSGTQIAASAIALSQRIIAGQGIIGIVQQGLELSNRLIPTSLFLIEPAQEVTSIRSIEATFKNLLAEVDSIIETTLSLKGLSLSKGSSDLTCCDSFAR